MNREATFKDRVVWTILSTAAIALASYLTERALAVVWERARGVAPPKDLRLLKPAGAQAGRGAGSFLSRSVSAHIH